MGRIIAPFLNKDRHIAKNGGVEIHLKSGDGMLESESLRMQCLPGAYGEAVVDKLPIFRECGPLENSVASVACIVEKRMPFVLHMHPDLMGAPCLEYAFHQRDIPEFLQDFVMGDGMFADSGIGENCHLEFVARVTGDVACDGPAFVRETSPYERPIFASCGLVEELKPEVGFGLRRFGYDEQSGCILVDNCRVRGVPPFRPVC